MSNFYRLIDYPSYFGLQQQLARFALESDLVHGSVANYYTPQDLDRLIVRAPLITSFLQTLELKPIAAGWTVSTQDTPTLIHIDHHSRRGRIEIPVIGCEYSYTAFYSAPVTSMEQQTNGTAYWLCDETRAQELDRFSLTKPAYMRVDRPYVTRVTRVNVRRISLGIVTDLDPTRFI